MVKRNLYIEIPIVIMVCVFIVLDIAVLIRAISYEEFSLIWPKWIYCLFAAFTLIGFLFYLAKYQATKNTYRIFFVLILIFSNLGIVCEFYVDPEFFWLDLAFDITFGTSFVLFIISLILIVLYYCTLKSEPVTEV